MGSRMDLDNNKGTVDGMVEDGGALGASSSSKARMRAQLERDIEKFLNSGGQVEEVPILVRSDPVTGTPSDSGP